MLIYFFSMPNSSNHDSELAAIAASGAIFATLEDSDARRRVLSYVLSRYLPEDAPTYPQPAPEPELTPMKAALRAVEGPERELAGIARLTDFGEFEMTLRELKSRSRLEAVIRLATVAIHAHQLLTGRPLSSRQFLTPLLKAWRLYDGNTRSRLAREQGIVRSGDNLSLDDQGRRDAERFVNDIHSVATADPRSQRFQQWSAAPISAKPRTALSKALSAATFDHIENWDNFTNKCSVGLHTVNKDGIVLWANRPELELLGYEAEDYIGHFIGDFHVDADDVRDILGILTRFETVQNYPARMRAKDGSIKFVMINSNVYRQAGGEFGHSRCFTTEIDEAVWSALKRKMKVKRASKDPQITEA
ncbi:MAG: PAS domain-containing protein [Methyloceanibacter sp.]